MTTKIWLRISGIILLVIMPIFLTQFIQQRQALFLAATLSGAVPEKKTLEKLRVYLQDYALLKPEVRTAVEGDFIELALMQSGIRDIIYAKNEAVFQLERQLWENAFLSMLAGLLAAYLVAKRIVRRVERLHLEAVEAARSKESLLALENWQKVARALVHELRAPVSPIKLVAGGLISKKNELKNDEYFRFSEQGGSLILEQVEIIEKMIDSFTRFAKLPPPELESQNVVPFLENFVAQNTEYSPVLQNLSLEILTQQRAVNLRFDAALLQRLFFNLLRNAVESNSSPLKVKLLLRVKNDLVEIEIQNSGSAIPNEIVQQLFALKLSLIQPISGKENGLGLGLMICRKIALDHGGDLELASNSDGNVTFLLRLPSCQGHII